MCEWCGREHDVKALCSARPKWSRRGFLTLFGAGLVGAVAAAKIPFADLAGNTTGTIGGINRATYSFWRNQQMTATADLNDLARSMREVYESCSIGGNPPQENIIIPANSEVLSAYLKLLA